MDVKKKNSNISIINYCNMCCFIIINQLFLTEERYFVFARTLSKCNSKKWHNHS